MRGGVSQLDRGISQDKLPPYLGVYWFTYNYPMTKSQFTQLLAYVTPHRGVLLLPPGRYRRDHTTMGLNGVRG